MKKRLDPKLKTCRARHPMGLPTIDERNCCYILRGPSGRRLYMQVSDGEGWDHVSVSLVDSDEPPTWVEMCFVKDTFWDAEEIVVQYHPAKSKYVNFALGCLHLWRPQEASIEMPPLAMV